MRVAASVIDSHFNSSCMAPVKMVFTKNRIFTKLKCFSYTHIASHWCIHFLFVEFLGSCVLKKFYPVLVKRSQLHLLSFKTFNRYLLFITARKCPYLEFSLSVLSPNAVKYGAEKIRIWILFTLCQLPFKTFKSMNAS